MVSNQAYEKNLRSDGRSLAIPGLASCPLIFDLQSSSSRMSSWDRLKLFVSTASHKVL